MSHLDLNSAAAEVYSPHGLDYIGSDFSSLRLRAARFDDLPAINAVIGRAVDSWALPTRVKRLGLPLHQYHSNDLEFLDMVVAEDSDASVIGVAAWEIAGSVDAPRGSSALLLHGIYVDPMLHRCGIGTRLFEAAFRAAARDYYDGLVVKAQASAIPFFEALGMERLPTENPDTDYPYRFWHPVRRV